MATLQLELLVQGYIRKFIETSKEDTIIPTDIETLIVAFFGSLLFGSTILGLHEEMNFIDLLAKDKNKNLKNCSIQLLYRASENDFSTKSFHELCDGKAPTFTIMETGFGNVFGGYTEGKWASTDHDWVSDENAFLFLIRSNDKKRASKCPMIFNCTRTNFAILNKGTSFGPNFGSGADVCIIDKCNQEYVFEADESNRQQMSYCYNSNTYDVGGDLEILSGGNANAKLNDRTIFFRVVEYEVFLVETQ